MNLSDRSMPVKGRSGQGYAHIFPTPSYTFVPFGKPPTSLDVSCRRRISRCFAVICAFTTLICCWACNARPSISCTSFDTDESRQRRALAWPGWLTFWSASFGIDMAVLSSGFLLEGYVVFPATPNRKMGSVAFQGLVSFLRIARVSPLP